MKNAAQFSELHWRLRQATKHTHHQLDHHPMLAALLRPDLTAAQYGNVLAAMHGFYTLVETHIIAYLDRRPGLFDYRARLKLPALESDLDALGRAPLAAATDFPGPTSMAALIGTLYTLEGSAMGGRVIARVVRETSDGRLPMRFFSGYGELTSQRWDEFLAFADAHCPPSEYEVAAAAAVAVFSAINAHLDLALCSLATA